MKTDGRIYWYRKDSCDVRDTDEEPVDSWEIFYGRTDRRMEVCSLEGGGMTEEACSKLDLGE